jgi:hypothetical protein
MRSASHITIAHGPVPLRSASAVVQAAVDVRAAHVNEVRGVHHGGSAGHDPHRQRRSLALITAEHRAVGLAQS